MQALVISLYKYKKGSWLLCLLGEVNLHCLSSIKTPHLSLLLPDFTFPDNAISEGFNSPHSMVFDICRF